MQFHYIQSFLSKFGYYVKFICTSCRLMCKFPICYLHCKPLTKGCFVNIIHMQVHAYFFDSIQCKCCFFLFMFFPFLGGWSANGSIGTLIMYFSYLFLFMVSFPYKKLIWRIRNYRVLLSMNIIMFYNHGCGWSISDHFLLVLTLAKENQLQKKCVTFIS